MKYLFFIFFYVFAVNVVFSDEIDDAKIMFDRIHNKTETWYSTNFDILHDFDLRPLNTNTIQISSLVLTKQLQNNTKVFQRLIQGKEFTEADIYFFYLEQFKLSSYLTKFLGENPLLKSIVLEMQRVTIQACLLLIQQGRR